MNIYNLDAIISEEFSFEKFKEIDTINGIQVSRSNLPIQKIAYAVDASLEVIQEAVHQKVDVLFVHHGFFWGKPIPINHTMYEKVKLLLENDIALYAVHLPLDAHMSMGNNAQLAFRLGMKHIVEFGDYKGQYIGVQGNLEHSTHIDEVYEILFREDNLGNSTIPIIKKDPSMSYQAIEMCKSSNTNIKKIAIITGGGTQYIEQAYIEKVDLYITGDASHTTWLQAKELNINVFFAGHYFTEIWGVLAVGNFLQKEYNIQGIFIDSPTGL